MMAITVEAHLSTWPVVTSLSVSIFAHKIAAVFVIIQPRLHSCRKQPNCSLHSTLILDHLQYTDDPYPDLRKDWEKRGRKEG